MKKSIKFAETTVNEDDDDGFIKMYGKSVWKI